MRVDRVFDFAITKKYVEGGNKEFLRSGLSHEKYFARKFLSSDPKKVKTVV